MCWRGLSVSFHSSRTVGSRSQGILAKLATKLSYRRSFDYYPSARAAFAAFLEEDATDASRPILLPAYIGWTMREGSGVYDPVESAGRRAAFYRVSAALEVDVEHFRELMTELNPAGVVIIHYFGYVDPAYRKIARLSRDAGVWVLEDEAHALLTDVVGGMTGRLGDAAIFSLHKILPVSGGGVLVGNYPGGTPINPLARNPVPPAALWDFDLYRIASIRRRNARCWKRALGHLSPWLTPLRDDLKRAEVPQSFPMLVRGLSRDKLHSRLNAAGVGVVSLYHTLISAIRSDEYPQSHRLSKAIINFPVHQDLTSADIHAAVPTVERELQSLNQDE